MNQGAAARMRLMLSLCATAGVLGAVAGLLARADGRLLADVEVALRTQAAAPAEPRANHASGFDPRGVQLSALEGGGPQALGPALNVGDQVTISGTGGQETLVVIEVSELPLGTTRVAAGEPVRELRLVTARSATGDTARIVRFIFEVDGVPADAAPAATRPKAL